MDHVAFYKRAGGSHTQNGRDTMKKSASAGYFCTEEPKIGRYQLRNVAVL